MYQDVLESAKAQVEELLQADEWLYGRVRSVGVTGRTKSIYSTWKKMQRHEYGIERINDLVALRVVLYPEVPEGEEQLAEGDENALCFHVLGKVHSRWTPLPRTLKDYISSPKPNGYRSLHTTVLVGTQPLEVQIRTARMHTVAEYGAAAHWAYKEGPGSASLPWLQIIRDWDDNVEDTNEFVQLVRQELLGTRVFIFSRNGRILNLAKGATLADAASQLTDRPDALRTHQVLVNGAQESAGYELHNGDIVDIDVDAQPLVEEEDASPQARARRYVAEQEEMRLASAADTTGTAPRVWKVCGACLPLPGDTVVGAVDSRQLEGTVHRAGCDCRELTRQLGGGRSLATGEDARCHTRAARTASSARAPPRRRPPPPAVTTALRIPSDGSPTADHKIYRCLSARARARAPSPPLPRRRPPRAPSADRRARASVPLSQRRIGAGSPRRGIVEHERAGARLADRRLLPRPPRDAARRLDRRHRRGREHHRRALGDARRERRRRGRLPVLGARARRRAARRAPARGAEGGQRRPRRPRQHGGDAAHARQDGVLEPLPALRVLEARRRRRVAASASCTLP